MYQDPPPSISENEKAKVADMIAEAQKITILGHHNPDPDCIISMMALTTIISQHAPEKKCEIAFQGKLPLVTERYSKRLNLNLKAVEVLKHDFKNKELLIIVDTVGSYRSNEELKSLHLEQFNQILVIDHHPRIDNKYEDENIDFRVMRNSPSTAEILFEVFVENISKLNKEIKNTLCEMLVYAALEDSKFLGNIEVTYKSYRTISEIAELGEVDLFGVNLDLSSRPLKYEQDFAQLMLTVKEHQLGFRYAVIDERANDHIFEEALNFFKSHIQKLSDGDIYIFIQRTTETSSDGIYKIRMRSKTTDLTKFYACIGNNAGGHPHSGGAMIKAKDDIDVLQQLEKKFAEFESLD